MKFFKILLLFNLVLLSCQVKTETHQQFPPSEIQDNSITYWDVQRKGKNYFNGTPTEEWFVAARRANIKFILGFRRFLK